MDVNGNHKYNYYYYYFVYRKTATFQRDRERTIVITSSSSYYSSSPPSDVKKTINDTLYDFTLQQRLYHKCGLDARRFPTSHHA